MTSIGLISDVHAEPAPLQQALELFAQARVDHVICVGDIAGYGHQLQRTVDLLMAASCESVMGNHEWRYLASTPPGPRTEIQDYFQSLPAFLEYRLHDLLMHVVHAQPPAECEGGMRLLDRSGKLDPVQCDLWQRRLAAFDYQVLVVGHTHQVFSHWFGNMLVINPGSSAYNHSCAILRMPQREVTFHALCGKSIIRSWNWGSHQLGEA